MTNREHYSEQIIDICAKGDIHHNMRQYGNM